MIRLLLRHILAVTSSTLVEEAPFITHGSVVAVGDVEILWINEEEFKANPEMLHVLSKM